MKINWRKLLPWAVGGCVAVMLVKQRSAGASATVQPKAGKGKHDWRSHLEGVLRYEPSLLPPGWSVDNVLRWIDHESGGNPYSTTTKGNERGLTQIHEGEWDAMGGDTPGWRKLSGAGEAAIDYAWHAKTALKHISYLANRVEQFLVERAATHNLAADDAWSERDRVWFTKLWHALPTFARDVFLSTEKHLGAMPAGPSDLEDHIRGGYDAALAKNFAKYGKPTKTIEDAWARLTKGPGRVAFGLALAKPNA